MVINEYILYCNDCGWVCVPADDVKITLDLQKEEYIFKATCPQPKCYEEIYNTRRR